MQKKVDKTIRNPAQAFGEFLVNNGEYKPVILATLITTFGAAAGINIAIDNAYNVSPDTTGSAVQEELVAYHNNSLSELKQQRIDLEKAEAVLSIDKEFNTITPEQEKALIDIKAQFTASIKQTLMELQMKGATPQGAGLSEENFDKLYNEALSFLDTHEGKIVGTEYNTRIETGMLDEYLAEIGNISDLENASQILNQRMGKKATESDVSSILGSTIAGVGTGAITIMILMLGGGYLSKKLPKHLNLSKRKGQLPSGH